MTDTELIDFMKAPECLNVGVAQSVARVHPQSQLMGQFGGIHNHGKRLFLFGSCDGVAKDARMDSESFKIYYPNWTEFEEYIDPRFSSSFWRRVTGKTGT